MKHSIKYVLLTCTIAYLIAVVMIFILGISQTGWMRIDSDTGRYMVSMVTLVLSEFQGWGDFWYLAVLVPWLGSSLLLALLIKRNTARARRRHVFSGVSIGAYYIIMLLVFAAGKLATFWGQIDLNPGDVYYILFLIWPLGGFLLGYLSAIITDKVLKIPAAN
jgi:hypothetical protein